MENIRLFNVGYIEIGNVFHHPVQANSEFKPYIYILYQHSYYLIIFNPNPLPTFSICNRRYSNVLSENGTYFIE